MPSSRRIALAARTVAWAVVCAACTSRTSELVRGGSEPPFDASGMGGAATDIDATPGGVSAAGASSSGGAPAAGASSTGGASGAPTDAGAALCSPLKCRQDVGCRHFDPDVDAMCDSTSSLGLVKTLSLGCGVASIVTHVSMISSVFEQVIYDLGSGVLVGERSMFPDTALIRPTFVFSCSDSRDDVRRAAIKGTPWTDCAGARTCTLCATKDATPMDEACAPDDLAQLPLSAAQDR